MMVLAASFVASCVDNNYDLANKKIATDVKIDNNTIALPVGGLKPVVLDSLIDVDDIEYLGKGVDGVYGIYINDSISALEEKIEPVTLNISPLSHKVNIEFDEPEISTIHIEETSLNSIRLNTPSVSWEELINSLKEAKLETNITKAVTNTELDRLFSSLESGTLPPDSLPEEIDINEVVSVTDQEVKCKFSCELPSLVEKIDNIKLASENGEESHGALVEFVVTHPEALSGIDKSIDFEISFPEMFLLAKSSSRQKLSADRHKISVDNIIPDGVNDSQTSLKFYIEALDGIADKIVDGVIDVDETIKYSLHYNVDGAIKIDKSDLIERRDLEFNVALAAPLQLNDLSGKTKEIEVPLAPITMSFDSYIDDLQYIDTIKHVKFDNEKSSFNFMTMMEADWFEGFALSEGYALKIEFPENLYFDDTNSQYSGKGEGVVYKPEEHAYYVYDLNELGNKTWELALDSLAMGVAVENGECNIKTEFSVYCTKDGGQVDHLMITPVELESMTSTLDKLKDPKTVIFNILESEIAVADAAVHTTAITSLLDTRTEFSLKEKIPNEIGRINSIDFEKAVAMKFDMEFSGLDQIDTDVHLDLRMAMPPFLKFALSEKCNSSVDIDIIDDTIFVKADYQSMSEDALSFELLCNGLDFMTSESGGEGLLPDVIDGDNYISCISQIALIGNTVIDDMDLHSNIFGKLDEIGVDVNVDIEEIAVKTFHGIYSAEIDRIEENLDLDLGEELGFLREEGNTVTLADPQFEFVLTNPVGIPVDINLHLFGNEENGTLIQESEIATMLSILPAEYDETTGELTPVETKLFFTTDTSKVKKNGFTNVQIPNLANLLKRIPYSINFDVKPYIRTTGVTHHVDIEKPIKLEGAYSVVVPLKFEDFHLCYRDTVDNLDSSVGETVGMFSNVSVGVKMDIINTIPLGLSLKVVPMDINGKVIEDIEIDELLVAAGNGEALLGANGALNADLPVQSFSFAIKSKSGDISSLDGLAFSLEAASDHTTGSAAIKGEQGIKISNIVFEVSGDIEADLKDLAL